MFTKAEPNLGQDSSKSCNQQLLGPKRSAESRWTAEESLGRENLWYSSANESKQGAAPPSSNQNQRQKVNSINLDRLHYRAFEDKTDV